MPNEPLREAFRLLEAGNPAAAEVICRDVLTNEPQNAMAKGLLGFVAHRQGRGEEGERLLLATAGEDRAPAQIQHLLGLLHAEQGALRQAAECFRRVVRAQPRHLQAWIALGEVGKRLGRPDTAHKALAQASEIAPDNAQVRLAYAVAAAEIGRHEDAMTAFRAVLQHQPRNPKAHFGLGNLYRDVGQAAQAMDHYHEALDADPKSVPAYINLGCLLQTEGRFDEAIVAFRKATEIRPDYAAAHFNLGNAYLAVGRLRDSEEALCRTISLEGRFAPAHNNLGALLLKQGREDEALDSFKRALAIDPSQADAQRNIANILKSRGELEAAVDSYRRALVLKPGDAEISLSLADALVKVGEPSEALTCLEAKLAESPADPTALSIKCAALALTGDRAAEAFLVDHENLIGRWEIDDIGSFEDLAAFNASLGEHVASHPTLHEDVTTVNGRDTGEVLDSDKPCVVLLRDFIGRTARRCIEQIAVEPAQPFALGRPQRYHFKCWGVRMWREGYQVPHIHHNAWLSGVYYVKLPAAVEDEDQGDGQGGWIEFGRGVDSLFQHSEPSLCRIKPKEGMLLTFPSYFWHRTLPFDSDEERISIAFDLIPDP